MIPCMLSINKLFCKLKVLQLKKTTAAIGGSGLGFNVPSSTFGLCDMRCIAIYPCYYKVLGGGEISVAIILQVNVVVTYRIYPKYL